eukprot:gb/GECG01003444.1/.p1 GENE.gb/GECG01003444.1/~~gb/GECG01003444.1/.p1  ORF type:complete len:138 (+),score=7.81 gb/GECG01003444.1/:1-414(+)
MGDTCTYREGRKDGPTKCAWYPGHPGPSPHTHCRSERPKILDSIDQFIGQTPMVRLNRIPKEEGVECEVLAKCEFFNSGGSVKDRIGKVREQYTWCFETPSTSSIGWSSSEWLKKPKKKGESNREIHLSRPRQEILV